MSSTAGYLRQLDTFLSNPERSPDCFNIHQLQGAIVASLSSPELVSDVDIGFLALGEEANGHEQWFEMGPVRKAWVGLYNALDERLVCKTFSLEPAYPLTDPEVLPQPLVDWCDGYLKGFLLAEESWQALFGQLQSEQPGDQSAAELAGNHDAFLNMVATFADLDAALEQSPTPERIRDNLPEIYRTIDEGVRVTHRIGFAVSEAKYADEDIDDPDWHDPDDEFMEARAPVVRAEPKVGRNDPCPCGSGKKYKKCCQR